MADIIYLKSAKLHELAELVRGYETQILQNLYFKSEVDQVQYLRTCNSNMESVKSLLDECGEVVKKYENDSIRSPIASLILSYTESCMNSALQLVRNYTLRRHYLDKVIPHVHELIKELEDQLDTGSAKDLTNKIQHYDKAVKKYASMSVNSEASKAFSSMIQNTGIGFPLLLQRHQSKLGFGGQFKDLEDEQKMLVYDSIIEASGRGKALDEETLRVIGSYQVKKVPIKDIAGIAVLLYTAASITWDVYTAENPIKEAAHDAVVEIAKQGGSEIGEIVAAASEAAIEEGIEISAEVATLVVSAIGVVVGFAASFILGAAAGALFDLIFGSGGTETMPNDGLIFHVATMPDGQDLAKQIA